MRCSTSFKVDFFPLCFKKRVEQLRHGVEVFFKFFASQNKITANMTNSGTGLIT